MKKFLKGPWLYIAAGLLIVWVGFSFLTTVNYAPVSTKEGLAFIADGKAKEVTVTDFDQRVDVTLKAADATYGSTVQFYYVAPRGAEVLRAITAANPEKFTDAVPRESWFVSLLGFLVPLLIIGVLFWFIASSAGGSRGAMQFGRSRAKLFTKESPQVTFGDVAGAEEALEELHEIKEFLQTPKNSKKSEPAFRRACCCTVRPERARRFSRVRLLARPRFRFIRFLGRTSSKCSLGSARAASVTCSTSRNRIRPPSFSSTRLTPWAATAEPVWAAVTTSANKL